MPLSASPEVGPDEASGRDAAVRSARRASARGGSHGHVVGTLQRARATRKHHLLRQRRREGAQHHATSTATDVKSGTCAYTEV